MTGPDLNSLHKNNSRLCKICIEITNSSSVIFDEVPRKLIFKMLIILHVSYKKVFNYKFSQITKLSSTTNLHFTHNLKIVSLPKRNILSHQTTNSESTNN